VLEFVADERPHGRHLKAVPASPVSGRRARPPRRELYAEGGIEPRLEDLLTDPLTEALMRRDGVNPTVLRELIVSTRHGLRRRPAA
jgi:hypothetical protein